MEEPTLLNLLNEIQSIARNGLHYSSGNVYDRERYEKLLNLAAKEYRGLLQTPPEAIRQRFLAEMGQITPKLGADAAIFDSEGRILLMERADGSGWCLPCGWVEVGEKPADAARREVREETGLEVEITGLVGVFTRQPSPHNGPMTMVAVVHQARVTGGALTLSHEGLALRYWPLDEVPAWHANHEDYARAAHAQWKAGGALPSISC